MQSGDRSNLHNTITRLDVPSQHQLHENSAYRVSKTQKQLYSAGYEGSIHLIIKA